jgi:hypothetical protein
MFPRGVLAILTMATTFGGCVEPRDTPLDASGFGGRDGAAGGAFGSSDADERSGQDSATDTSGADSEVGTGDGRDAAMETSSGDAVSGTSDGGDGRGGTSGLDAAAGGDARAGASGQDAATGTSDGGDASAGESGSAGSGGAACPYKANYGDVIIANNLMFTGEQVVPASGNQPAIYEAAWNGIVRNSATPDQMSIDLVSGLAPFGSMLTPVTVDLSTQKDFQTCGACVLFSVALNADASAVLPEPQSFIAISGNLNIAAVPSFPATASSRITGSLSNVVFEHVNIDSITNVSTKIDNCQIVVTSAAFDAPVKNN